MDLDVPLRELCEQEVIELVEGRAMSDHVHLCLVFSVANTVGFPKGKSDTPGASGKEPEFHVIPLLGARVPREHVGLDEETIRAYIRNQEDEEKRQETLPSGGLAE